MLLCRNTNNLYAFFFFGNMLSAHASPNSCCNKLNELHCFDVYLMHIQMNEVSKSHTNKTSLGDEHGGSHPDGSDLHHERLKQQNLRIAKSGL